MPGSTNLEILLSLLPLYAIYLGWMIYTSQRAFKIRNSVLVPTHRYQALWVGASAIYWLVIISLYLLVPFLYILFPIQVLSAKVPIAVAGIATLCFGLALSLAWTDAIVPIARSSDPRNRDTFRWHYSRAILWAILATGFALAAYLTIPPLLKNAGMGVFGPIALAILFYYEVAPFFVFIGTVIAIVLFISYFESRDVSLRKHLKWLIAYTLVLVFQSSFVFVERQNVSTLIGNTLPGLVVFAAILSVLLIFDYVEALCLYKCAQSLAPINRFPTKEQVESKF
jgi:hypothetical protein